MCGITAAPGGKTHPEHAVTLGYTSLPSSCRPIVVNMILTHILGLALGSVLVKVARAPPDLKNHMMLTTTVSTQVNRHCCWSAQEPTDTSTVFLGSSCGGVQRIPPGLGIQRRDDT
jgi:hypothetical protein